MGDNKGPAIAGGLFVFLLLPLLIVIAMILGAMSALGGEECVPSGSEDAAFSYPTKDKHDVKAGWDDGDPAHKGIDYDVPKGTSVVAAADGQVIEAGGDTVRIRHGDLAETRYKYVESIKVGRGDKVVRGDELGKSGGGDEAEPGATGDHLHFELWVRTSADSDLAPIDPASQVGEADAGGSECGCGGGGPLVGSNNQEKAFNYFTSNGYSKEQAAGILGNMIAESGVEPARLQNTLPGTITHASEAADSSLGWGIVQWTPAGKMIKPSQQAGLDDSKIESLEYQLDFLNKQLNGQGPVQEKAAGDAVKAAKSVEDAAVAFGGEYERFDGYENLSHPTYAERKANAREVFETYGGGGGGGSGGGCGAGNGDIVATAKLLAWDTPGHDGTAKSLAKPEYQEALPKYNGSEGYNEYTDCGVFVATVMRMSGVDKEYPVRGTSIQEEYLRNSGKYEVFDNFTRIDQLQPGDIMIGPGHTYLYIGPTEGGDGETYGVAAASLNGHVPEYGFAYMDDGGKHFSAARLKK